MNPPVHITIDDVICIASFINIQNAYIMLHIVFPGVNSFMSPEAEHFSQTIGILVITPQIPFLYKAGNRSCLVLHILHFSGTDTQLEKVLVQKIVFPIKYLIHNPLKIQQIHPLTCIPDAVTLLHIKIFQFPALSLGSHHIIQYNHIIRKIHFFDRRYQTGQSAALKVRPVGLCQAGINRYFVKCGIIAGYVRLPVS